MHGITRAALAIAFGIALVSAATAAPPWAALFPFQRVEADPKKEYLLTDQQGPWMVLCMTFGNQTAKDDAKKLCLELRRDFQLEAFIYAQNFDFNGTERGLGYDRHSTAGELKPKTMKYLRDGKFQEWAVMVGNFTSVEDPALQATLQAIKHAHPPCLKAREPGQKMNVQAGKSVDVRDVRQWVVAVMQMNSKDKLGAMGSAFATPNPLRPEEAAAPSVDQFVIDINADSEHSLFKCPGKYTVRVATFRGKVTIDQREIGKIERGGELASRLEDAGDRAHAMTMALRAQGVEAYEFHDRVESIVTIGSFDSVGTPRDDGKIEMSPAVRRIMDQYGPTTRNVVDKQQGAVAALMPKTIKGIPYDVQPWPVAAPKIPVAASAFGAGLFR